jgi:hypothetical protein
MWLASKTEWGIDAPLSSLLDSRMPNSEIVWSLGHVPQLSALEGVEGHAEAPGLD